ncbi:cytochrome P450 [Streptomyces galbus]|uniref:cytochrome P450 n=1 Tax=Streptomyces galbus TaxID=33898 RepID=UPI0037B36D41
MPPTPRDADRPEELRFSRMERLLGGDPVSTVTVDGTRARFVTDPELVRRILVTDARHYGKSELLQKARVLSKSGLLAPDDARHRHYRRLAHPHLRAAAVTAHAPLMQDVARATAASWRPGQPLDIQAAMCRAAGRIALHTLLGATDEATSALLTERLAALSREMTTKPLYGKAARAERPARRLRQAFTALRTPLARCITARPDAPHPTAHHLSALLTDAGPAAGRALDGEEVCDEAVMMLTAATVTTASVMSWALYTLARHPLAEEKVLKDLAQPADPPATRPGHGPPGYTLRFLMEVLRLHPPVWITSRRTLTPVILGEHTLPAGTDVVFSSYLLHRHPAHYRDPHRFDPDRWLTTRPQDAAYLPFGTGARGCVGETFAWQELHVLLAAVAQEWRLTLQPGTRPRAAAHTTLHPHRLFMIPQPR